MEIVIVVFLGIAGVILLSRAAKAPGSESAPVPQARVSSQTPTHKQTDLEPQQPTGVQAANPFAAIIGPNPVEIIHLCEDMGLTTADIEKIERRREAVLAVEQDYNYRRVRSDSIGKSMSKIYAEAILREHDRSARERVVRAVLQWANEYEFFQFQPVVSTEEYQASRLSDKVIDSVYNIDRLDCARMTYNSGPITSIPDAVFDLPRLKVLVMGEGGYPENYVVELTEIPKSIANSTTLESLHLQYCGLTELPSYMFLPTLRELKIGGNDIKMIPDAIGKAVNLEMLTAWMNDLEYISSEIGQLKKLKRLDVFSNERLRLPSSIVNLGKMVELEVGGIRDLTTAQIGWLRLNGIKEEDIFPKPKHDSIRPREEESVMGSGFRAALETAALQRDPALKLSTISNGMNDDIPNFEDDAESIEHLRIDSNKKSIQRRLGGTYHQFFDLLNFPTKSGLKISRKDAEQCSKLIIAFIAKDRGLDNDFWSILNSYSNKNIFNLTTAIQILEDDRSWCSERLRRMCKESVLEITALGDFPCFANIDCDHIRSSYSTSSLDDDIPF